MLEHLPAGLGHALHGLRAGAGAVVSAREGFTLVPSSITLQSASFDDGDEMPQRFTADGDHISPPLNWTGVPRGTETLVLVMEDPDAPSPEPLVHLLALFPGDTLGIPEGKFSDHGALGGDNLGGDNQVGRNSYLRAAYLPPDPPPGHGPHHYMFQLFALDYVPDVVPHPGRSVLIEAMQGHVLAKGTLTGVYSRI